MMGKVFSQSKITPTEEHIHTEEQTLQVLEVGMRLGTIRGNSDWGHHCVTVWEFLLPIIIIFFLFIVADKSRARGNI